MRITVFKPFCIRLPIYLRLLAACLLSAGPLLAQSPAWTLVWSDEFNQPDGSSPDSTKWTYDTGGGSWGNSELEYYTSRTNNARIAGGCLVIEANQENYSGSNYTSARLKTQGKWSWTYGRMEARIKLPRGQGMWPAFWTLGTNIASIGWPKCGEIDIMENIGREPTNDYGTIHGPVSYSVGGRCVLPGNPALADDFHLYAVEWTTNQIKWYLDSYQYFSATPASLPGGTNWVFTLPQFLLLNLSVGGNWPGSPDGTTVFPQQMLVDYVRVYAPTNLPPGKTNLLFNPGFELPGLTNWTSFGAGFNTVLENIADLPVHSDTNMFKVFGQFTGATNISGVRQDVPASAGQSLVANAWMLTPANDPIAGANSAWIEISFRDAATNLLSLYRSTPLTANTPPGLWLNFAVTNRLDPATLAPLGSVTNLLAPANTHFARCQLTFSQPAAAAGSVLFDDVNLSAATAAAPVPVAPAVAGRNLNLVFATYLGLLYQVNWENSLTDANWSVWTNLAGSGSSQTVTVDLLAPARYFRVTRSDN